jgi:hypothetical protein
MPGGGKSRHRRPAQHQLDPQARLADRIGDQARPRQMPDPQQMLDIDEHRDAHRLPRPTRSSPRKRGPRDVAASLLGSRLRGNERCLIGLITRLLHADRGEQANELGHAGAIIEVLAHPAFTRRAEPLAQLRRGDGARQRRGQGLRVLRRHQDAVDLILDQFRHPRHGRRHAAQALALGLDQHVGQPVAVAVAGDPAGQHEQVRAR